MRMMRCCRRMPAVVQPVHMAHARPAVHVNTSRFTCKVAPFVAPKHSSRQVAARAWGDDVEFTPAKVLSNTKAAADMHLVTLEVGADIAAGYKTGGQYMQMKVGDSKPAYMAVANAPSKVTKGNMDFLIKNIPDTTAAMIIDLAEGDELSVSAVMGKGFPVDTVPADKADTMLIFATGSGISPIAALIEEGALDAANRKQTTLYYGTTDIDSMAFADKIPAWEEQGVKVVKVFSKRGEGYVQDVYAKGEPLADGSKTCVLLCGQKDMADSLKAMLGKQGVPEDRFLTNF